MNMGQEQDIFPRLPAPLLAWYDTHARVLPWRGNPAPYRVWISEIMLQQTRVEAVKPYFERFLAELPDLEALAAAPEDVLLKLWEGLGYYNRVRNLRKAAKAILERYGGVFPSSCEELMSLPGIGEYTAGAIASISFGLPCPAVDGNVLRVIARVTENRGDVTKDKVRGEIASRLKAVYPAGRCGDFTQSLMELGATVCLPNGAPKCEECPLAELCLGFRNGTASELPVKTKKKARREERRTVFLLRCGDRIALRRRSSEGVLAGLWEFPNVEGALPKREVVKQMEQWGLSVLHIQPSVRAKHVFTHLEWQMSSWFIECAEPVPCFHWVTHDTLCREISLPSAWRAFAAVIFPDSPLEIELPFDD